MLLLGVVFVASLPGLAQTPLSRPAERTPTAEPPAIDCAAILVNSAKPALRSYCQAEQELRLADAAQDKERESHLKGAADSYRRAVMAAADDETKTRALERLALVYDRQHLAEADVEELILRELIALSPASLQPIFRLAALQESRGLIDAAESTLLSARQQHPDQVEPLNELARFYARRATALHTAKLRESDPGRGPEPSGQPDEQGVYRVGGPVKPPARVAHVAPLYPPDAAATQIQGVVILEVVVDETGRVAEARVLRSIPLLDEAALASVKQWRFEPTIVDGKPVPVRMTTTVNFTQPK